MIVNVLIAWFLFNIVFAIAWARFFSAKTPAPVRKS